MRPELILILIVGFASALPLVSERKKNVNYVKELLENSEAGARSGLIESLITAMLEILRNLMINGTENLPPLDPLTIERIHIDEGILNIPNAYITMNNLTISDISTFEVEELEFSMASLLLGRYKLEFNIVIPSVNVKTEDYDLSLTVFGGDIYGKGDMSLQIIKPRVKGFIVISFSFNDGIFMNLHECKISVGLDAFEPTITGMFHNEASSDFVSRFLGNLIPEMLTFFETEITNILSFLTLIIGNLILYNFDFGSLLPFPMEQVNANV